MRHSTCTAGPSRRASPAVLPLVALLALAGCASAPDAPPPGPSQLAVAVADSQGRVPAPLAPYFAADRRDGPRNAVLNAMLAGQHALDLGQPELARRLLDQAYQRIEVIYADNETARAARSKFVPEANKDFKGEPHERAMVGYYLGLADLLAGDLDNARSAFQWGEFQDTMSVAEEYQADMASMQFLAGWVQHCQGQKVSAAETLAVARQARAGLPDLAALTAGEPLLLIAETGQAPRKTRRGQHGEALAYVDRPLPPPEALGEVQFADQRLQLRLAEDLHMQATTLGGRQVDQILAGKASFKDSATSVAEVGGMASLVGSQLMQNSALQGNQRGVDLGGAMALGGLLANLIGDALASATRTEADTRMWHTLPETLYFAVAAVPEGAQVPPPVQATLPGTQGPVRLSVQPQRVPGTACWLARLSPDAAARSTWQADQAQAWLAVNEAERVAPLATPAPVPVPATAAAGRPPAARTADVPPPPPAKPAPVRASF